MNSSLLKELLDLGDAFELQYPDKEAQTTTNFLIWASQQGKEPSAGGFALPEENKRRQEQLEATFRAREQTTHEEPSSPARELPTPYNFDGSAVPIFIAEYSTRAYRYLSLYVKKAYENVPIATLHDYISLITLAKWGSQTKTELIEATINEKTSGMLVIKRLIDCGLVSQTDNANDKRSRCVDLTDAGWDVLKTVQPAMDQACMLMMGNLTESEQGELAKLLLKINRFHEPLYLHHREDSLTHLLAMTGTTPYATAVDRPDGDNR